MNEKKAREILCEDIKENNDLENCYRYLCCGKGDDRAVLDDSFSADELEAISWWMRNVLC